MAMCPKNRAQRRHWFPKERIIRLMVVFVGTENTNDVHSLCWRVEANGRRRIVIGGIGGIHRSQMDDYN